MAIDNEVLVGRILVLTDTRLEQGRALERREAKRQVVARGLQRFGPGEPVTVGRIEVRASRVVGDLEAPPLVARNPVHEMRPVIRPDRHGLLGEAAIAGRSAEEEHFLLRGSHAIPDDVGKQRAQPRTTGKHESVRTERRAIRQRYRCELAAVRLRWLDGDLAVVATLGAKAIEHCGAGTARAEIAAVPLVNRPADMLAIDLRISSRGLCTRQLLKCDLCVAQDRQGGLFVLVIAFHEPEDANAMVELASPAGFVLLPEHEGTCCHARVDRARSPSIGRANHPRFAAGAGSRIAGSPGIEKRDSRSATAQVERRPAAERASSDHDDVRFQRRASRTARRTVSLSEAGSAGPHGSSHASSGITPSAASAQSMRRTYPSMGSVNVAWPNASNCAERREKARSSPFAFVLSSCACRSVSAEPMPISAARAPIINE